MKNLALIVAAGAGKRFGGAVPKQYQLVQGEPVLLKTIRAFLKHPQIDAVRVVIAENDSYYGEIHLVANSPKLLPPVTGGAERQDSVRLGLQSLEGEAPDNVLIHDAARPFVDEGVIERVIAGLVGNEAAIPVIDAKDSARYYGEPLDRKELKFIQTPQGFHYEAILRAHSHTRHIYTDDAQVAEVNGIKLHFVEGAEANIKITTTQDLKPMTQNLRTGMGYDVHGFETGTHVTICGIKIPHSHGLKGHSDADVGLHALVDAILGAIGEGDIGEHFPPSQAEWKGADSAKFVEHAVKLVKSRGGYINNADITIICEEPKLTPHKAAMKARVAELLEIPADRVNVKATTTEKLGFTGRKEGIAAQVVATVIL